MKIIKKDKPPNKDRFFVLEGYPVKVVDGKFHCNGMVIDDFKQLVFSVNYFNKKLKDTK